MKHRIFIAINLPEDIKKRLVFYQEKIEESFDTRAKRSGEEEGLSSSPTRALARSEDEDLSSSPGGLISWTKKDNLHITLEFLGYVADEKLLEICQNTKELASKLRPFTITLNKISYSLLKTQAFVKQKHSVAGKCFAFPELKVPPKMVWAVAALQNKANFALFGQNSFHITLGRIKTWQWKQIEPEERPEIDQEINLNFEVNSIEIMESVLKREGPKYTILESIPFSE